jgi:hypothetical protein
VKCNNVASSTLDGVNSDGHCEAGNGGNFEQCRQCVADNPACNSNIVNWQPNSYQFCKCVVVGDPCTATSVDANYQIWTIAATGVNT